MNDTGKVNLGTNTAMALGTGDNLLSILSQLVQPNGKIFDSLYGASQGPIRALIMRSITGNPKYPKSRCGANAVFESLCELAGVNQNNSHAGQEAQLVKWIKDNQPQCTNLARE